MGEFCAGNRQVASEELTALMNPWKTERKPKETP
jgi:hypothetical protein